MANKSIFELDLPMAGPARTIVLDDETYDVIGFDRGRAVIEAPPGFSKGTRRMDLERDRSALHRPWPNREP